MLLSSFLVRLDKPKGLIAVTEEFCIATAMAWQINAKFSTKTLYTIQLDVADLSSLPMDIQSTLFCEVTSCSLVAAIHCLQLQDTAPDITFQKTYFVRRWLTCPTVPLPRLCPVQTCLYFPCAVLVGPYKVSPSPGKWVGRGGTLMTSWFDLASCVRVDYSCCLYSPDTKQMPISTAIRHWSGTTSRWACF